MYCKYSVVSPHLNLLEESYLFISHLTSLIVTLKKLIHSQQKIQAFCCKVIIFQTIFLVIACNEIGH